MLEDFSHAVSVREVGKKKEEKSPEKPLRLDLV
jgi:hypothetical protein